MLFSYLVLIFCSPGSWLNTSKYRGVVRCTCDHRSSLPAFITVVCAQKLTLIFHNPTQEHIRVRRECFHCVCFLVGCWARKSPTYKQILDICCTKPTKAFLPCWAGKGHPLSWPLSLVPHHGHQIYIKGRLPSGAPRNSWGHFLIAPVVSYHLLVPCC